MSPHSHLYFKVGSFKCISLSLYGIFFKFITSLVAVFFGFFSSEDNQNIYITLLFKKCFWDLFCWSNLAHYVRTHVPVAL